MCWEHEDKYTECMDLIFEGVFWDDEDGLNELLRRWGIDINKDKKTEYQFCFFEFLTKCEKNGIFKKFKKKKEDISG